MFTCEELRAISLFADVADTELDYLTKTSADIRLLPGEYVVHEGESRRAVFVLIEGRIEGTKFIDGAERVIGVRESGQLFGEGQVVLDTPALVSFRAMEPSRVMQIESKEFHAVAATSPQFFSTVVRSALDRVEGLQELAAATPPQPIITMIAPHWDSASHELREFLQRNSVEFDWLVPEDPAVAPSLDSIQDRRYPMARLRDGSLLVGPSVRDIAKAIGLCVSPSRTGYDLAIIGGGPAGLAAAVYGASEGLSTVLFEREAPGGQAGTSSRIENYLGFPFGISGAELANRALQQARRFGADIVVTRTVESLDVGANELLIDGGAKFHAKSIVIATGVQWRQLDVPSLDRLRGRGVYYGAAPGEASSVQGQDIYLVGGGNSAGQAALNFSRFANSVTLLVRGESLSRSMSYYLIEQLKTKSNVRVQTLSQVVDAYGDDHLEEIAVSDATGKTDRAKTSALFILIGADADTQWLPSQIDRDARGYVITGPAVARSEHWPGERDPYLLETTVPGIFAVGDVRAGSVKRVAASVGEGSMAIALVHQHLASIPKSALVPTA